jgi:signal peptidase I
LAVAAFKKLWKNEYFQTAVTILLILSIVFGFWYGVQFALNTEHPALAVASTSMLPTLKVGDLIIVQGVPPDQIHANYLDGDIVVFRNKSNPEELIVHRAVRIENTSSGYVIYTKGDNVPGERDQFSPWPASLLVGKVLGKIPWIGNLALLMQSKANMYMFIIVIIVLIVLFLMFPFESEKEEKQSEKTEKWKEKKLIGKISFNMIYLLIVNILIVSFIAFSLWGAFAFWQPGANPAQNVPIHGMYPDVEFHGSFSNVHEVYLISSFLTYTINANVSDGSHEGVRLGVPTFSWAQAAIILLIVVDVWELLKFLRLKKKAETAIEIQKPILTE